MAQLIETISGYPGSGKTLFMTMQAEKYMQAGWTVRPNFEIDFSKLPEKRRAKLKGKLIPWTELHELSTMHDCLVLFDEALIYASGRSWQKFPEQVMRRFFLQRHYRLRMFIGAQDADGMDPTIRRVSPHVREMHNLGPLFWWNLTTMHDYMRKSPGKRKNLGRGFFLLDKELAACYDSESRNFNIAL